MILVDTSVWIDHFRGADTPEAERLASALAADEDLCVCGMVLTEVLQGVRGDSQHRELSRLFETLVYLDMPRGVFEAAAGFYRSARAHGKTLRSPIDCLIAACAIHHRVPLLQRDHDFETIAAIVPLALVPLHPGLR